jgi:hypothetical protein
MEVLQGWWFHDKFSPHVDILPLINLIACKRNAKAAECRGKVELALRDLAASLFMLVKGTAKAHGAAESTVCGQWKGGKSKAEGTELQ